MAYMNKKRANLTIATNQPEVTTSTTHSSSSVSSTVANNQSISSTGASNAGNKQTKEQATPTSAFTPQKIIDQQRSIITLVFSIFINFIIKSLLFIF